MDWPTAGVIIAAILGAASAIITAVIRLVPTKKVARMEMMMEPAMEQTESPIPPLAIIVARIFENQGVCPIEIDDVGEIHAVLRQIPSPLVLMPIKLHLMYHE